MSFASTMASWLPEKFKKYMNPLYDFNYLLWEMVNLLKNDPNSLKRFTENLMNLDFNYHTKEGYYKILPEHAVKLLRDIYDLRRKNPEFNADFQKAVLAISGTLTIFSVADKLLN